jgi:hypothetical protein
MSMKHGTLRITQGLGSFAVSVKSLQDDARKIQYIQTMVKKDLFVRIVILDGTEQNRWRLMS